MVKCVELESLSVSELRSFFASFDTVMTDCDGVLWRADTPIGHAPQAVKMLRKTKRLFYCTNNSTKTRAEYVDKCHGLGFGGQLEDIIGSSYLAAKYLKSINYDGKVYVVGSPGLTGELDAVGIRHTGVGPDPMTDTWNHSRAVDLVSDLDEEIKCVIAAFDPHISYIKMVKAASILSRPNSIYVATNTDEQFPFGPGVVIPGTGAIVAAVTTAAQRQPKVMGKPCPYMFEAVREEHPEVEPARTLMIGDRANTDILLGTNCGLQTLLVGTGCHSLDDVRRWEQSDDPEHHKLVPNFYVPKFDSLIALMEKAEI